MSKITLIRAQGGSRVIAITKVIPKEWQVVKIKVIKELNSSVTLKIDKVV